MSDHRQDRFDETFRHWAGRPPSTPPQVAARQVMGRLSEPRGQRWSMGGWLPAASAAAALALVLVVGWATLPAGPEPSSPDRETLLPPLDENVVLLWLDDRTPLYLTVAPPATEGGT